MTDTQTESYTEAELQLDLRWWAAANYLTVTQIYLMANPLLSTPLKAADIKPRLLGHWGTSPGLSMIYALLNRLIRSTDVDCIYITGPDPEIVLYLIEQHGYRPDQLRAALNHDSGLAGIAGGRHDLRDLLAAEDADAKLALDVFTTSAAMAIACCAITLDDWQALVFTGGVGEHAAQLRDRICARLLALRGTAGSTDAVVDSGVRRLVATGLAVLMVPADEEAELDRLARQLTAG